MNLINKKPCLKNGDRFSGFVHFTGKYTRVILDILPGLVEQKITVQVEAILMSVLSMLNEPNISSPVIYVFLFIILANLTDLCASCLLLGSPAS